jgi:plasmid stability protein
MPTLTIRNLPDHVHSALRTLAAQDGISVEAEVRNILTNVCTNNRRPANNLQQLVDQLYQGKKPDNVVEALLQERKTEAAKE